MVVEKVERCESHLPDVLPDPDLWPNPVNGIVPLPVSEQASILGLLQYVTSDYCRCHAPPEAPCQPRPAPPTVRVP